MRLLLDTHILLRLLEPLGFGKLPTAMIDAIDDADYLGVSVASLWEIAIKHRLGKLQLLLPIGELPGEIESAGGVILPVSAEHALRDVVPWPPTDDPFDRMLLAVCACDDLRLLTTDAKLAAHPLAWAPPAAA